MADSDHLRWELVIDPPDDQVMALREKLRAFNRTHRIGKERATLALFVHDEEGALVGGIVAERWGAVLEIDFLWIEEHLRGKGIGHTLLTRMEQHGYERGTRLAVLDTFDFQAPQFYRNHGYEQFAEIDGFPDNHRLFLFRKTLPNPENHTPHNNASSTEGE